MSCVNRLKKAAALLLLSALLLTLSGRVFAAEIVPDEEIEDSRYAYQTAEITRGDIEVLNDFHFTEFVWQYREIRYHGEERICKKCHTRYRGEIQAGDPVITLVTNVPELDIEEEERALQRKIEGFERKKQDYQETRNAKLRQMNESQDQTQHDLLSLQIQKDEVEFEKLCYDSEREIAAEEARLGSLREEIVLTAPVSGFVSLLTDAKDGKTVIHDGDVIARIRYAERLVVAVSQQDEASPAKVHYGSRARFVSKTDGQVTGTVEGYVIASNYIQEMSNSEKDTGWAMVSLDVTDEAEIAEILDREKPINSWTDMYYIERDLKNVLRLPRSAVKQDDRGDYVLLYRDGDRINKRYVSLGAFCSEFEYELLYGLREGEQVVTKERSF